MSQTHTEQAQAAVAAVLGDVEHEASPGVAPVSAEAVPLAGTISTDPGVPCTPEYAGELTQRARAAIGSFYESVKEIVRVRAWEVLGYDSPQAYFLAEFIGEGALDISRSHQYRLMRVISMTAELATTVGNGVLDEVTITDYGLRNLPAAATVEVMADLEAVVASGGTITQEVVDSTLAAHKPVKAPKAEQDSTPWDSGDAEFREDAYGQSLGRGPGGGGGSYDDDHDDDGGPGPSKAPPASSMPLPMGAGPLTGALAEGQVFAGFVRALHQVAGIGPHLPGIVENASDEELVQLIEEAEQAREVLAGAISASRDLLA